MTPEQALAILRAEADPTRAAEMAAYHKTSREVLGIAVPRLTNSRPTGAQRGRSRIGSRAGSGPLGCEYPRNTRCGGQSF